MKLGLGGRGLVHLVAKVRSGARAFGVVLANHKRVTCQHWGGRRRRCEKRERIGRHNSGLAELFLSRFVARFIEVVGVEGLLHIEHVLSIEKDHFVSSH